METKELPIAKIMEVGSGKCRNCISLFMAYIANLLIIKY